MVRQHNGSLKYQVIQRMKELNCIGESKHQAKQEYKDYCSNKGLSYNPGKTVGIHSYNTFEAYKQTNMDFVGWLKKEHPEIKSVNSIDKSHAVQYLQKRLREGKSAYTLSKDVAALNKVLGLALNKRESGLPERSYKGVTRSRNSVGMDSQYNPANYKTQIEFAKAFGCRRESINGGQYQVKDISLFKQDGKIFCSMIEKGGRYREAPCLQRMQAYIEQTYPNIQERGAITKEEFKELYRSSDEKLFDSYTSKIDNHAFRGEYARELYAELLRDKYDEQLESRNGSGDNLYRGYHKDILHEVSEALGHNRLSVVVEHYLR